MKRFLLIILFVCIAIGSYAQSSIPMKREGGTKYVGSSSKKDLELLLKPKNDENSRPVEYQKYQDEKDKEMEQKMAEREWNNEDSAWKRASSLDTKEAYQRYVAMYPHGVHRPDASQRLIDLSVNDIMENEHGSLPQMVCVESDDDSPTSTIVMENRTPYVLTVMYSGPESKSVAISPGTKGTVIIQNGRYRIAASVPVHSVRPFAGSEMFAGGRYETGYIIVWDRW